jgi:hypothetical protein
MSCQTRFADESAFANSSADELAAAIVGAVTDPDFDLRGRLRKAQRGQLADLAVLLSLAPGAADDPERFDEGDRTARAVANIVRWSKGDTRDLTAAVLASLGIGAHGEARKARRHVEKFSENCRKLGQTPDSVTNAFLSECKRCPGLRRRRLAAAAAAGGRGPGLPRLQPADRGRRHPPRLEPPAVRRRALVQGDRRAHGDQDCPAGGRLQPDLLAERTAAAPARCGRLPVSWVQVSRAPSAPSAPPRSRPVAGSATDPQTGHRRLSRHSR